ncbi:MAG: hypothetical protein IJC74_04820 [Clostridia bacterium]|nr:hypothetical protein [Clostridia bacterium]
MKKLLSILMVCAMILSLCTVSFAEETTVSDELLLFDFADEANATAGLTYTTEKANDGKAGSAAAIISKIRGTGTLVPPTKDWSGYEALKITAASKYNYTDEMIVIIHFDDAGSGQYAHTSAYIDSNEFKDIIIPLSTLTFNNEYVPDWTKVKDIQLYFEGWSINNAEIDYTAEYYFDEISLLAKYEEPVEVFPYEDVSVEYGVVLNALGSYGLRSCSEDKKVTLFDYPTAKWKTAGSDSQVVIDKKASPVDISAYDNVYVDIYSPKVTADDILIRLNESPYKKIVVDWKGWKTVAIPLSTFGNPASLTYFEMFDYGWETTYGANNESLNIGRIWIGNTDNNVAYENKDGVTLDREVKIYNQLSNKNFDNYETINFLLSNDKNNNAYITFVETSNKLNAQGNLTYDIAHNVNMDFEGKKVISIPMSTLKLSSATTNFVIYTVWGNGNNVNSAGNTVKLHKIWYSNDNLEAVTSNEQNVEFNTYASLDLNNTESITLDLYSGAVEDVDKSQYATAFVLNDVREDGTRHNHYPIPLNMNFEGWKSFEINLADYPLCSNSDVTIYVANDWGLAGYAATPKSAGISVKVRNITKKLKKNYPALIYTTADKTDNECYYVFNSKLVPVEEVTATVVDKETGNTVDSELLLSGNKVLVNFDAVNKKSYDVTLKGLSNEPMVNTFTYDSGIKETKPEVTVDNFVVSEGVLSNTEEGITVNYDYQNGSDASEAVVVIIAIYKADGTLAQIWKTNFANIVKGRRGTIKAFASGNYTGYTAKAFVWNNQSGITPVTGVAE